MSELDAQMKVKQNCGSQSLEQQFMKVIQFKNNEVRIIEKNHANNIQILNEMKKALEVNKE